jgi:UDP-N-acetylglucosamine/UDP-N-acetyl-alpha-D-glucosaminouronate 4-epimerase
MKTALVTGGAGFIGSALVRGLLRAGVERVVVIDNLLSGKKENLAEVERSVEFHRVDIRDYNAIEPLFSGMEVVFHEAGLASVPRSIEEPLLAHDINIGGTLNVFLAAQRQGVRRVVFAASSSAYGDSPELPKTESLPPQPKSPYAVQKLTGEYYAQVFWEAFGLETVSLRYFNVFGPRQDPASPYSGVLSIFSACLLNGRAPTIFGDGEQSRDFIYVEDIVRLNLLAARSAQAPGKVYNGGTGKRHSLRQTWSLMQELAGANLPAQYAAERSGDVRHSQADISLARRDLGFEPSIDFEEGLRRTLEWYREQVETGAPACPSPQSGEAP